MKKILIPYDFSLRSKSALKKALLLAKRDDYEPVVLHAINISIFDRFLKEALNLDQVAKDLEAKIKRTLSTLEYPTAKVLIKIGSPVAETIETAKEIDAKLIVLGDHGEFHLKDILLGTTARGVVASSPVPVLVVKNDDEPKYEKVLIATDFSPESFEAYKATNELFPNAHFLIYHGYAVPSRMVVAEYGLVSDQIESALESIRTESADKAKEFANRLKTLYEPTIKVRSSFSPSEEILEVAGETNSDLIVLGAKGGNSLVPFLLGSVTDSLLQYCGIDILIFGTQ